VDLLNVLPWLFVLAIGAILTFAASVYMWREAVRSRSNGRNEAYAAVKVSVVAALVLLLLSIACVTLFIRLIP
jgi:uncharacterized membrane protein YidH (DUF202 family)